MKTIRHAIRHRALVEAAYRHDLDQVRALLRVGHEPTAPEGWLGRSLCPVPALTASCGQGALEIAELLLEAGADPADNRAGAPLEAAVVARSGDNIEMVRLLLSHGAPPTDGVRAAAFRGDIATLSQLHEAGADLSVVFRPPVSAYRIPPTSLLFLQTHGISLPEEALERLAHERAGSQRTTGTW